MANHNLARIGGKVVANLSTLVEDIFLLGEAMHGYRALISLISTAKVSLPLLCLWSWDFPWDPFKKYLLLSPSSKTLPNPLFDLCDQVLLNLPSPKTCTSDSVSLCNMDTMRAMLGRLSTVLEMHKRHTLITRCTSRTSSSLKWRVGSTMSNSLSSLCSCHAYVKDEIMHLLNLRKMKVFYIPHTIISDVMD